MVYKLCKGETEIECTGFIDNLYRRGLKGKHLKLVVTDGSKGIIVLCLQFFYDKYIIFKYNYHVLGVLSIWLFLLLLQLY